MSTSSASDGTSTISAAVPSAGRSPRDARSSRDRTPASASLEESAPARWFRSRGGRGRSARRSARPRPADAARRAHPGPSSGSRRGPAAPARTRARAPSLIPRSAAALCPLVIVEHHRSVAAGDLLGAAVAVTTRTSFDRVGRRAIRTSENIASASARRGPGLISCASRCLASSRLLIGRIASVGIGRETVSYRQRRANCSVSSATRAGVAMRPSARRFQARRARRSVDRRRAHRADRRSGRDPVAGRRQPRALHERRRGGPFTTSPRTSGLTATTGAGLLAIAARSGSHRQDRANRDHRVRRTDHDRPCGCDRVHHLRCGRLDRAPWKSTSSTGPSALALDHELLKRPPRGPAPSRACGPAGRSSAAPVRARRGRGRSTRVRRSGAGAGAQRPRALEPDREIPVAEVEPDLDAELAQAVHHVERVAGEPPAALVDQVGEPERDEVRDRGRRSRRRSRCRRPCWRSRPARPGRPRRASRGRAWRRPYRRRGRRQACSQARDLDPRPDLVADVDRDEEGVSCSTIRAISSGAAVDRAQTRDQGHEPGQALLVLAAIAADQHVLVELVVEVASAAPR